MLSRVAENIYWMSRYIERAENTARLIDVNTFLLLDLPKQVAPGWEPLIAITGSGELYRSLYQGYSDKDVTRCLVSDRRNPGSILSSLQMARENCRTIRDVVPRYAWEQINQLYLWAEREVKGGLAKSARVAFLKGIIHQSQAITGLLAGTMNHDEGYDYLRIGRNLERADMTTRIIDVRSQNLLTVDTGELRPYDHIQWVAVLKSLTGYHMYRRSVQTRVRGPEVLGFLFQNPQFPRSVLHCINAVEQSLVNLPSSSRLRVSIERLRQRVLEPSVMSLGPAELSEFVDQVQIELAGLNDELYDAYFSPLIQFTAAPELTLPRQGLREATPFAGQMMGQA